MTDIIKAINIQRNIAGFWWDNTQLYHHTYMTVTNENKYPMHPPIIFRWRLIHFEGIHIIVWNVCNDTATIQYTTINGIPILFLKIKQEMPVSIRPGLSKSCCDTMPNE